KIEKSKGRVGEFGRGRDNVDRYAPKSAESVAFDRIINFGAFNRHHFGRPPTDARRTAIDRAGDPEIFRVLLFGFPRARGCFAWFRRCYKRVTCIVQTNGAETLLVKQPRELKYAEDEGDQQRYHRRSFDQRGSSLVPPKRLLPLRKHAASWRTHR